MKIALAILITIHGIIHLFGFLKAFGIAEFDTITDPISKPLGLVWLLAFVFLLITAVSIFMQGKYWWAIGLIATIISQFLIFNFWSEAKFGTIANIIILGAAIVAYATYKFENNVLEERKHILKNTKNTNQNIITEEAILGLPKIVQKWLKNSGTIGNKHIENVYLIQDLQLKMKEDQEKWNQAKADQFFTTQIPAFNWAIDIQMNSVFNVVGRDKFENGNGEMLIKAFSLIPIADAKNNQKIDEATMQRFLAEMVWFPSAALNPYLKWEQIDDQSAKATMSYRGSNGSGVFYFDTNGEFVKFTAMRYKDAKDEEPTLWTVSAIKTEKRNGIKIPVECEAKWKLESGDWTWLKLKIVDIEYNIEGVPVAN